MATLTISVSGPPQSGKTDLLALIRHVLEVNGVTAICKTDQLASSPKMADTPDAVQRAISNINDRKPLVVLEEIYDTPDGGKSLNHDDQEAPTTVTASRINPLH